MRVFLENISHQPLRILLIGIDALGYCMTCTEEHFSERTPRNLENLSIFIIFNRKSNESKSAVRITETIAFISILIDFAF